MTDEINDNNHESQPDKPETPLPAGETGEAQEHLPPPVNERFKWYIIHAYSGFERKVKESLEGRVQAFGLQNKIGRVMIPTEPVTELVNGKKRTVERVFLPGYVLVEMELDNDLWHVIKNTPRVTGFLGTGDKPVALMRGHGDVAVGPTVKMAVFRAYYTDVNARLQAQAIGLGSEITYLSPEEGAKADQVNFAVLDRVWNLWKQKVQPGLAK